MEDPDKYLTFVLDVTKIVAPFVGLAFGIFVAAPILSKLGVRVDPQLQDAFFSIHNCFIHVINFAIFGVIIYLEITVT